MGELDDILEAVYEAADDPDVTTVALRKVGALLGAFANHTLVIDTVTNTAENHHYGGDPASFLEYDRHWRSQDPRFAHAMKRFGTVLSDVAVIDSDEFERSAIYNEHLALAGTRYTLFGTFRVAPDLILGAAFMRTKRQGAFAEDEIRKLSAVAPHLVRAVRLRRTVDQLRCELADLRHALDAVVVPMMVLDSKARIVCANRAAEEVLAADDGLRSTNGRLTIADVSERSGLERALAAATLTAEGRTARRERPQLSPTVKVSRRDDSRISLVLLPLRPDNEIRTRSAANARVLVVVHDPSRVARIDRTLIADLHGLTATEAELAASIAEGKTLAEFAAARGSSEQTARTHLKRILEKTETGRQADLVRVLLTGVALRSR